MKTLRLAALLTCFAPWLHAVTAPPLPHAVASSLEEFLGEPVFVPMQQLWEKRGGWGGIITTPDGTVVAFQSPGGPACRRSTDGGKTWGPEILIGEEAKGGNAIIDESNGDLLYVNPYPG
ncbi:MAG: glycoside hydrolase, partial [Verrucomicrobia bacterium]|nr:glycoside hydrolase [Verrucomicrobiota bacterium]